ncbi:MAG: hypothetical protein GDA53_02365 [Rhodobacteraceae bacterium]|nr:hypothetical protein [Paracoccaceae bacterium]
MECSPCTDRILKEPDDPVYAPVEVAVLNWFGRLCGGTDAIGPACGIKAGSCRGGCARSAFPTL